MKYNINYIITVLLLLPGLISCKKFFEVPVDEAQVVIDRVFGDDQSATSAVNGMYRTMVVSSFAGGGENGITMLAGLSADEFRNISREPDYLTIEENQIDPSLFLMLNLWSEAYKIIYQSNDIIEELGRSENISAGVKDQLIGECLLVRSFCYFYLRNIFGDVPLITTSDYRVGTKKPRTPSAEIYTQIIEDLKEAESRLSETYPSADKARPNKYAAKALLARVYLFTGDWENAALASTGVISNAGYIIETNPGQVFTVNSAETIWQLASEQGFNTKEGSAFQITTGINSSSAELRDQLLSAFDNADKRRSNWTNTYVDDDNSISIVYPYKYKAPYRGPTSEYFVILRLAEQYLIRAEARAKQGHNDEAIADIDIIRDRAGLELLADIQPDLSGNDLEAAIMQERQKELFAEWGHRWFDLKRTGKATSVLQPIKAQWSDNDQLYPLPTVEFSKNPFLGKQNNGY